MMSRAITKSPTEQLVVALCQPTPQTVLLTGTDAAYRFSLRCVARVAGRRPTVYLDGANTFDPYEVARHASVRGLSAEKLLRSVFVRRAFTCYQMNEMVRRLPVERLMSRQAVLVVAGPCTTFFDESVPGNQAARLFYQMFYRLKELSRARLPLLIVQSGDCPTAARRHFLADLKGLSQMALDVKDHMRMTFQTSRPLMK
jgi:hypothetical protein